MTTPAGTLTAAYDPTTHRLMSETDILGRPTTYVYDATTGVLVEARRISETGDAANDLVTSYTFDQHGNMVISGDRQLWLEPTVVSSSTFRLGFLAMAFLRVGIFAVYKNNHERLAGAITKQIAKYR